MSRHSLTLRPDRIVPAHPDIVIGWDSPLHTFFGYVKDLAIDDEADPILFWVGTTYREILTVEHLVRLFEPWAEIPPSPREKLAAEAVAPRR